MDQVVSIACLCAEAGVPYLSVYDKNGKMKPSACFLTDIPMDIALTPHAPCQESINY